MGLVLTGLKPLYFVIESSLISSYGVQAAKRNLFTDSNLLDTDGAQLVFQLQVLEIDTYMIQSHFMNIIILWTNNDDKRRLYL